MASSATPSSNAKSESQYHHYIPRFILRTFSHQFRPIKGVKRPPRKALRVGEDALYTINLDGPPPWIRETSVSRTFGLTDMYRDSTTTANQHDLEQRLSVLESDVGRIVADIRKAYDEGKQEISLKRARKDVLRKFLFVQKYRSSGFQKRFNKPTIDDYDSNDAHRLKDYMIMRGYERPIDVWFNNLKALLDVQVDANYQWIRFLKERMYPDDALWAITNILMYYMCICTPADKQDEFILTQNAYSIFEGPVSQMRDPQNGNLIEPYTEFHMFFVISPKIALVLRSFLIPNADEDKAESIRLQRKKLLELNAVVHADPSRVKSILEDLPVKKARNSYTKIVDGRIGLKAGEDGTHKPSHRFFFRFFPISTVYTNMINFIMLQESHQSSTIVFKSKDRAAKVLEDFFHYSRTNLNSVYMVADLGHPSDDLRMICLDKLQQAAKELGANVDLVTISDLRQLQVQKVKQSLKDSLPETPSKELDQIMAIYGTLGGTRNSLIYDMEQTGRMLKLRIKIDVWSQGIAETTRQQSRDNLHKIYRELPPCRFWLYLKRIRSMESESVRKKEFHKPSPISEKAIEGSEDIVGKHSNVFKSEDLTRLMYFAWHNENYFTKDQSHDRVSRVQNLAFGPSGTICNCGIPALEKKAMTVISALCEAGLPVKFRNPYWNEMENLEMSARVWLRPKLGEILGKGRKDVDVESLDWMLFEIVYPTAISMEGWGEQEEGD